MNFTIFNAVLKSGLPCTQRMILTVLLNHADESNRAWPSQARIASQAGLAERSVRTHLAELCANGWLEATEKTGQPTVFRLVTPANPAATPANGAEEPRQILPTSNMEPRQTVPDTPANPAATPANGAGDPGKSCLLTTQEQTITNPENQNEAAPQIGGQDGKASKRKANWREEYRIEAMRANLVMLPLELAGNLEVAELWKAWCDHRTTLATREKSKPWTEKAAQMEIANIARAIDKHGQDVVCAQIRSAISSSWQGLNLQNIRPAPNWHQRRPRHEAYNPKTATEGKTLDQILNF